MFRSLLVIAGLVAVGVYLVRDLVLVGERDPSSALRSPVSAGASEPSVTSAPLGSDPGETAPDFTVPTSDDGAFRLSSYRGRTVVMDFLAPGCLDCTAEISALTKTWEAFNDEGVVVLVLDVGGLTPAQAATYYRGLGGGDLLYGEDRGYRVGQAYEVIELTSTFVIDPRGVVTFRDSGFTSWETLRSEVGELLQ
jgi:peroxiredoxin